MMGHYASSMQVTDEGVYRAIGERRREEEYNKLQRQRVLERARVIQNGKIERVKLKPENKEIHEWSGESTEKNNGEITEVAEFAFIEDDLPSLTDNQHSNYQILVEWLKRKFHFVSYIKCEQLTLLVSAIQQIYRSLETTKAIGPSTVRQAKKEALKLEIHNLIKEKENIFGRISDGTTKSVRDSSLTASDSSGQSEELLSYKSKLEQWTIEKQKEQEDVHAELIRETKRKHEEEMKTKWANFNSAVAGKLKAEKEEFLEWSSTPDF